MTARRGRPRWRDWPWWAQVVVAVAVTRAFGLAVVLAIPVGETGAPASWARHALRWDGRWYHMIAASGYPPGIPRDAAGHVVQSAWAFLPAWPLLARAATTATHLPFGVVAPALSLALTLTAALLLHRVVSATPARAHALAAVVLWSLWPASPVLALGYSEPLAAALMFGSVLLVQHRRYWWAVAPVLALGVTRPVGLPLLALVGTHAYLRVRGRRMDSLPTNEALGMAVLAVSCIVSGLVWTLLSSAMSGEPNAYVLASRGWFPEGVGVPFSAWAAAVSGTGVVGVSVIILLVAVLLAAVLCTLPRRALPPEIVAWHLAGVVFLVAVTTPSTSLPRYLLLGAPGLWMAPATWRGPARTGVAVASALLLVAWVDVFWSGADAVRLPP